MTSPAALPQAIDVLSGHGVPFPRKALTIDAAGRIARRDSSEVMFRFAVVGTEFRASARTHADCVRLAIEADLAHLPFSAEAPEARRALQRLAQDGHLIDARLPDGRFPDGRLPDGRLPDGRLAEGRLVLIEHRRLSLSTRVDVPASATPIDVIAGLVAMVLELRPTLVRVAALLAGAVAPRAAT